MSSAFPPERRLACGLPDIPAIEGSLIDTCIICEVNPLPKFNPAIPLAYPPSADFGCYPLAVDVDFDPDDHSEAKFEVEVKYSDYAQTRYCKPKIKFTVRMPGGACGTIECRVATTENITLSGHQTIDDVDVETGDLVLVKNQTDEKDNDVYIVYSGSWQRYQTAMLCNIVLVRFGTQNKRTIWQIDNEDEPDHGTDEITFAQIGGGQITCRLRLTDTTTPLSGIQTVDGVNTVEGDLIAVDTGITAPDTFDGIWVAMDAEAWIQVYTVDPAFAPGVPVLAAGATVTVWDGYSSPWLYVVGLNYYDAPEG